MNEKETKSHTNDHNNKAHLYKPDGNWVQKGILTPSEKATKKHKKWLCVCVCGIVRMNKKKIEEKLLRFNWDADSSQKL